MKKILISLALILLLITPIGVLIYSGQKELVQYEEPPQKKWDQMNYGEVFESRQDTIYEEILTKGKFVASQTLSTVLPVDGQDQVSILVQQGAQVKSGSLLAQTKLKQLKAPANVVIKDILQSSGAITFVMDVADEPILEVDWPDEVPLQVGDELTTSAEEVFKVKNVGFVSNGKQHKVQLQGQETRQLGSEFEEYFRVGQPHENVIVIERQCIYQKNPQGPYYVQTTEKNGKLIGEQEVQLGVSSMDLVNVIGLEEGVPCDSGYAQLMIPLDGGLKNENSSEDSEFN